MKNLFSLSTVQIEKGSWKNSWNKLVKTSDEFVKKLQQKNSGVVVWPIEACNIFSRLELSTSCEKKGGKEKKNYCIAAFMCVCTLL